MTDVSGVKSQFCKSVIKMNITKHLACSEEISEKEATYKMENNIMHREVKLDLKRVMF
jgi:hypothetical protein